MNALDTLFVNQYVEIEDREGNMLVAQIQDIDEISFKIGSIISKHRVSLPTLVLQEVFVSYRGESGDRYQFKTRVMTQLEKSPAKLQLAIPGDKDVLHIQQREYFRVPAAVKLILSLNEEDLSFVTKDISGGGVSFLSKDPKFKKNQSGIQGNLYIANGEDAFTVPFVSRIVYVKLNNSSMFQTAIEFTKIRESHRERIIKFCMKEQLRLRNLVDRSK